MNRKDKRMITRNDFEKLMIEKIDSNEELTEKELQTLEIGRASCRERV